MRLNGKTMDAGLWQFITRQSPLHPVHYPKRGRIRLPTRTCRRWIIFNPARQNVPLPLCSGRCVPGIKVIKIMLVITPQLFPLCPIPTNRRYVAVFPEEQKIPGPRQARLPASRHCPAPTGRANIGWRGKVRTRLVKPEPEPAVELNRLEITQGIPVTSNSAQGQSNCSKAATIRSLVLPSHKGGMLPFFH